MPACHFCSFVHSITTFVLAYVCLNTNKAHFTAYTHIDICFTQTSQCSNKYGDMNSTRLFAYLLFTDWHKLKDRVLYLFTLTISLGAASLNHHFCSRLNVSSKYKQKHTHGMGTQTHANKHTQTKGFIFLLIINYYYFHRLARWRRSWKIIDSYCTPICTLSSQKTRILALNFTSSSWSCICIFDYLVRACVLMCLCVVVRACVLMCLCVLVRACACLCVLVRVVRACACGRMCACAARSNWVFLCSGRQIFGFTTTIGTILRRRILTQMSPASLQRCLWCPRCKAGASRPRWAISLCMRCSTRWTRTATRLWAKWIMLFVSQSLFE